MIAFFLLGVVFVLAAFLAAAYETVAQFQVGVGGMVLSAYDLCYTYWPGKLVVAQVLVERHLHPLVWDPVITAILHLPAWLILGAPGMTLLWNFRPARPGDPQDRLEEETLYLYDALAKQAREEGYDPSEDDMAPDHGPEGEFDGEDVTIGGSFEDYEGDLGMPDPGKD